VSVLAGWALSNDPKHESDRQHGDSATHPDDDVPVGHVSSIRFHRGALPFNFGLCRGSALTLLLSIVAYDEASPGVDELRHIHSNRRRGWLAAELWRTVVYVQYVMQASLTRAETMTEAGHLFSPQCVLQFQDTIEYPPFRLLAVY
jgi:hypothetical protein